MVDCSDISVVVQGPVHADLTKKSLQSIRQFLPASEIILSTWNGQNVADLDYDILIKNDDPGAITTTNDPTSPLFNNLNRQIVSTRNGLAAASRSFVAKVRSDCILTKPLRSSLVEDISRDPNFSIFKKPVISLTVFTRNPLRNSVLFHFSDIFMFGLRSDLQKYWSADLVTEPEFSRWMENKPQPLVDPYPWTKFLFRCSPEQYLAECFIRTRFDIRRLRYLADGGIGLLFTSLRVLANNFQIVTPESIGIVLPAGILRHTGDPSIYSQKDLEFLANFRKPRLSLMISSKTLLAYLKARIQHSIFYYKYSSFKSSVRSLIRATPCFIF